MIRQVTEESVKQAHKGAMPDDDGRDGRADPFNVHSPEVEGTNELRASDSFDKARIIGVLVGLVTSVSNSSLVEAVVGSEFTVAQFVALVVVFIVWLIVGSAIRRAVYKFDDGGYGLRKVWVMVVDAFTIIYLSLLSRYAFTLFRGEMDLFVVDYGMVASVGFVLLVVTMVCVFYVNNLFSVVLRYL